MKNSCYVLPLFLLLVIASCKKTTPKPGDNQPVNNPEPTGPLSITSGATLFVGESVVFTSNQSAGAKLQWKFGDGNTSEDVTPKHTYTKPGSYKVSVSDNHTSASKQVNVSTGCSRMAKAREWAKEISYTDISGTTIINSSQSTYALSSSGENYLVIPGDSISGYFLQKPSLYFESYAHGVLTMSNKGDNSMPELKYYISRDSISYTRSYHMLSPTKCSYVLTCHTN